MKSILIAVLSLFLFFGVALAEEEVYNDNSVQTYIDLGNGDGAIIILGNDNNTTIYLPENNPDEFIQVPNEVTFSGNKTHIVMMDTEIINEGVVTIYKKIVLILKPDGWELVWWEQ